LVELMGGELTAVSPSGLSGDSGMKVTFTILTHSNYRPIKEISPEKIVSYGSIKTLVITGSQNRDEEILGTLHKIGLTVSVTTFQRSTINQIKANLNFPENRYNLILIIDDKEFDGFDAATEILESNLSTSFIIIMISKNDKKGKYIKSVELGIDNYLVTPFDSSELLGILKNNFPYIEDPSAATDFTRVPNDAKILVVEDNRMNQKAIGTMLKSLGYSFDIADDGYAGYLQAKNNKYDLILMDLIMPEMDGFESSQKILEMDKSMIIVAFSADNMPESKRKAELSGIKDFISKPVRIEDLKKIFTRFLVK
jgi:CheY-like chemotaxis protein